MLLRWIVTLCAVAAVLPTPALAQGPWDNTLTSPCARVFKYDAPIFNPGTWSGVATLTTDILLHSLWLDIVLDGPITKLRNWVGNSTAQNDLIYTIENEEVKIYPDQPLPVHFFIDYDPSRAIPRLRSLRLNGLVICNDETYQKTTTRRPVFSSSFSHSPRTNLGKKPLLESPQRNETGDQKSKHNIGADVIPTTCGVIAGGNVAPLTNNGILYPRGEVPWLVAIYKTNKNNLNFICGGTLVSDRHVITAAHCMQNGSDLVLISEIVVKLGVHSLNDWGDDLTVTRQLMGRSVHEEYDPDTLHNDILILTLVQRVKFNTFIRPACLWRSDPRPSRIVGAMGVIAGWGAGKFYTLERADDPQMVIMPIVSTYTCGARSIFDHLSSNISFCAGKLNGAGPRKGDAFSGFYLPDDGKWAVRGVFSTCLRTPNGDCDLNEYIVYTDLAQYLPWIKNVFSQPYYEIGRDFKNLVIIKK